MTPDSLRVHAQDRAPCLGLRPELTEHVRVGWTVQSCQLPNGFSGRVCCL